MASEAELLALAERCEKAVKPDRRLDEDIAYACRTKWPSPKYTSSVDAASKLLPPFWYWELQRGVVGCGSATIGKEGDWGPIVEYISAATPALALCAAALRARAATMGGGDD